MDTLVTILTWAGYLFAVIGFVATAYKSIQIWANLNVLSWRDVDRLSKRVMDQIEASNFTPEVIVTIGRGGAVLGAIISGNIRSRRGPPRKTNIPLLGVDRMYEWNDGQRVETHNKLVDFSPLVGKRVLLVAGDVLSGGTMRFHLETLRASGVKDIRTACLVKGVAATVQPDFVGKEILADFRMPWMYKGCGYVRDSRQPVDKKKTATA